MNEFIFITVALIANCLIAFWVYADAKSKGLKRSLCVLLFILTLSNTFGLIIYAIFRSSLGQRSHEVICNQCHARISHDAKFCPNCGVAHSHLEMQLPEKPKKHLLLIGILLVFMLLVFAFYEIITQFSSDSWNSLRTRNSVSTKWGNTWKMRFKIANGTESHTFQVKEGDYGLIYSSNITDGDLKINFCDHSGNLITELLSNSSDTLRDVKNGAKYKVIVTANDAKGSFSFHMKDLKK
ncbi:MAG: zinc ribbon domain-containing protein [Lentimicrobiaceae bacterium]|nr:zinc ribbon domain-containing protein [Lentimicrobiaceae bacterium]